MVEHWLLSASKDSNGAACPNYINNCLKVKYLLHFFEKYVQLIISSTDQKGEKHHCNESITMKSATCHSFINNRLK